MKKQDYYLILGGGDPKVLAVEAGDVKYPFLGMIAFASGIIAMSVHWLCLFNFLAILFTAFFSLVALIIGLISAQGLLMPRRFPSTRKSSSGFWGMLMGASALIIAASLAFIRYIFTGGL